MAVNEYTYGQVAGVARKVGWVTGKGNEFTGETDPSDTDVELILDEIASTIHGTLSANGYPIDTYDIINTAAPRAAAFLRKLNNDGAAADLVMQFSVAGDPEGEQFKPSKYWAQSYKSGLKLIATDFLDRAGLTRTQASSDLLESGSWKDDEGNVKAPLFRRGQFDFPSSRSLTNNG